MIASTLPVCAQRRADEILRAAKRSLDAARDVREGAYAALHDVVDALALTADRAPVHRARAHAEATEVAVDTASDTYHVALWAVSNCFGRGGN